MKKILLATDLEINSDRAMERALKIAQQQGAVLHIMHVVPSYKTKPMDTTFKKDAEQLLKAVLVDEFPQYKNVNTKIEVVDSKEAFAEILEYADKIKADLIVMGIHGKTKIRDLFVGTTVERVIRMGRKPVLMVKNKAIIPYDNIVSGIDLAPASRNALRIAMELYPKASYDLVHTYPIPHTGALAHQYAINIYDNNKEVHQKEIDAFKNTEESYFSKIHDGAKLQLAVHISSEAPLKQILKVAKKVSADLLTIGAHGKSIIAPSKIGGVAADILANPPCDILVVKE